MEQYGFYFDAENCIGCHTCHVACKDAHDLPVGQNFRTVRSFTTGSGFSPRIYHISMACNHCVTPACMAACSPGAILRSELGLVVVDNDCCNGCGDCVTACPYAAIVLSETGKATKCDGCAELRDCGEEVACVASCPQRVLEFGQVSALKAAHSAETLVADAAPLPISMPTKPNLLMRLKDCMGDKDFDEIVI
jgi:anaerobic dimethyl sulfoxide reductase subunit B (iron-sulfur subunit)